MKLYGTHLCPDCEEAQAVLDERQIAYDYVDITAATANLKEFLRLRDRLPVFDAVKENGMIGIPCFVREDGAVTLDVKEAQDWDK